MKWVAIIIGGLVLVVVLVSGIGFYFMNQRGVDLSDPNVASNFKDGFYKSCVTSAQKALEQKGIAANDQQTRTLQNICSCASDQTLQILSERKGMSLVEMTKAMISDPEVKSAMQTCAAQNGVTLPQQ